MLQNVLDAVRKTAGAQSGYRTAQQFQDAFNVNVTNFPTLFQITKTGLVNKLPKHEEIFQNHIRQVKRNWNALGVGS